MRRYRIAECTVEVGEDYVVTIFPDGTRLHAVAQRSSEDAARAHALGYGGDVEAMTREHDVLHSLLAEARGLPYSPTLYGVATGSPHPTADDEERVVMLLARWGNEAREVLGEHA